MIYTFGNSHSHLFTDSKPSTYGVGENTNNSFKSISLGPTIAFNFYEHHFSKLKEYLNNLQIDKDKDFIMLIIGEVDCRWHLPYQASIQNQTNEEIVKECIDRFFRVYLDLKNLGYNLIGWGGHPSTRRGHSDDASEPIFGDCLTRNKISLMWNNILKTKCQEIDIPFISIVEELIDEDGLTYEKYFLDYCHLDHNMCKNLIKNKFNEINISVYE